MARRVVDPQKQRLYAAEDVLGRLSTVRPEVKDVQLYVARVQKKRSVLREFPMAKNPVKVGDGRGRRRACARRWAWQIVLPRWSRTDYIILHELAHLFAGGRASTRGCTPHGPIFVGAYLLLVDEVMGQEAGELFREKLREHRVDWASWVSVRPSS